MTFDKEYNTLSRMDFSTKEERDNAFVVYRTVKMLLPRDVLPSVSSTFPLSIFFVRRIG